MTRPRRPLIEIRDSDWSVQITDDQSRTLIDSKSGVAYHSASGGFAETKHVYLENSGIGERMRTRRPSSVLEIGLGLGLGCLLTVDAALEQNCPLHFTAVENQWLTTDVLRRLKFEELLNQPQLATEFLQWRDSLEPRVPDGRYERAFGEAQRVVVQHGDAAHSQATSWLPANVAAFDAIYLDPFAPDVNPELWAPDFLRGLRDVLSPDGFLVTYCVNRKVRDAFAQAGFEVERIPGPRGGKREVLRSRKA